MLRSATLISYPVGTDQGGDTRTVSYRPPLGLLLVADRLEALNVKVRIVDLALEWVKYQDLSQRELSFAATIAESLAQHDSAFFGFSSIAGTMPLSVRIAQLLRPHIRKRAQIGFGGPGASSVATELLRYVEEIDFVLSGEVEGSLAEFVRLYGTPELQQCPNLVWRDQRDGRNEIICNQSAPLPDDFPQPNLKRWSYDVGLPVLPIELGRGCPYACQFCSTKDFFGRAYRLKPVSTLLSELKSLLGDSSSPIGLEFVHDLFTVNRKLVLNICNAIISSGLQFSWSCSSHINCSSPELIEHMARAGCRSIFFGIESGSNLTAS
ncbi:B12-binding domain-containing radical SAM protein [Bradyrhizobium barranii]|uniref:B12-binding domain-containing radical SAM protein n=1 Tax=Bradyrhizobium barranii TaxID=2992140 RepID=UPI001CCEF0C3